MSTIYVLLTGIVAQRYDEGVCASSGCPQDFHAEDLVANSQENITASSQSTVPKDIAATVV